MEHFNQWLARRKLDNKEVKSRYAQSLHSHFTNAGDTRQLWQGFNSLTDYKPHSSWATTTDPTLPDVLNSFFARFEAGNTTQPQRLLTPPCEQTLQVSAAGVENALASINPHKTEGPDNIPGRVLKLCSVQLKDAVADIFNVSLSKAVVPGCLKKATMIPVPKNHNPAGPNDYRPVALTPVLMKSFLQLVMQHLKSCLPANLDPLQFAYKANRSTEDALTTTLHSILSHLEGRNTYARVLFIDFSSAFNAIIPQQLVERLRSLNVGTSICDCIPQLPHTAATGSKDGQKNIQLHHCEFPLKVAF